MSNIFMVGQKFAADINGKIVKRSDRKALERLINKATIESVVASKPTESRFSINDRFGFVTDMVNMVANGDQASVIVTGPGGLGKSFTVTKALADAGMVDVSLAEDFAVGLSFQSGRTFRVIKGYSTPKGLYQIGRAHV